MHIYFRKNILKYFFAYSGGAIGIFVGISFWSLYVDVFGPWIEWFEIVMGNGHNFRARADVGIAH